MAVSFRRTPPERRIILAMEWTEQREAMIQEQLVRRGIRDTRLLDAFRSIPRHRFVPDAERAYAYDDRALPIGYRQTISQPYMVGIMLTALALTGQEKILEIGAGSGYEAALLGRLAREVHAVEIVPELAARARAALRELGASNVRIHIGDGSGGMPSEAPFDAIVLAAAAPEVPPPLGAQLASGGRLLLPLGVGPRETLLLLRKEGNELRRTALGECTFVPLVGTYGVGGPTAPSA
jgi:protein-L-isoaspartate(D-aspartate) O-methyltransferase